MPDIASIWAFINDGGLVGFLLLTVIAFMRGWVIPREVYERERDARDTVINQYAQNTEAMNRVLDALWAAQRQINNEPVRDRNG